MQIVRINGALAEPKLRSNCYVLVCDGGCCVIDPSFSRGEIERILLSEYGMRMQISAVVLTHCHADHCAELFSYAGIPIWASVSTMRLLLEPQVSLSPAIMDTVPNFDRLTPYFVPIAGTTLEPVPGAKLWVKHTPGHTADSSCFGIGNDVFVGDLAFCGGGFGRTDLPTGSRKDILDSLDWLCSLPPNMRVHSGHGEEFRVGDFVRDFNKWYRQSMQ